jgi:hypothetical protein
VHTLRVQGTGHGLLGKAKTPLSLKVDRNYRLHHSATAGFELEDKAHSHKLVLRREAKEVAKVSTAEGDAAPRKMKFSRAVRAKLSKLWHKAVP